jgi:hypothetical protein
MPGELGDEESQQQVGYYEHRFDPDPDWFSKKDGISWRERVPKDNQMQRVLKRLRDKKYKK